MRPSVMQGNEKEERPWMFRMICRIVRVFSPRYTLYGTDNLPEEPCVIVGNHCQMYGPIAAELYLPRRSYTWCIGEMMDRKKVPAYAFQDFWSAKPRRIRWFYRLLSHMIAPLSEYVFTNAHTIPVYRDARAITTFRKSVERMNGGADVVIFPESARPCNGILWQFQEHFADLARMYYRKTGKAVCFVPMYTAPSLKSIHFGEPVRYDPLVPDDEERMHISNTMTASITRIATSLPQHIVVPYVNIPKSQYPLNTDCRDDGFLA